jgi:hypothetical protein
MFPKSRPKSASRSSAHRRRVVKASRNGAVEWLLLLVQLCRDKKDWRGSTGREGTDGLDER